MTESWLQREQTERYKDFEMLESLEGFCKLSPKQKQVIKMSLYLEDRISRSEPRKYKTSHTSRADAFCHGAVFLLENGMTTEQSIEEMDAQGMSNSEITTTIETSFAQGNYIDNEIPDRKEVSNFIEKTGFPCVVIISFRNKPDEKILLHSCVALGKNKDGEIMIWEKVGRNSAYRLIRLKDLFQDYGPKNHLWGTRKIEVEENEE